MRHLTRLNMSAGSYIDVFRLDDVADLVKSLSYELKAGYSDDELRATLAAFNDDELFAAHARTVDGDETSNDYTVELDYVEFTITGGATITSVSENDRNVLLNAALEALRRKHYGY